MRVPSTYQESKLPIGFQIREQIESGLVQEEITNAMIKPAEQGVSGTPF
jgi:predicted nuclease with TOPRIM domain